MYFNKFCSSRMLAEMVFLLYMGQIRLCDDYVAVSFLLMLPVVFFFLFFWMGFILAGKGQPSGLQRGCVWPGSLHSALGMVLEGPLSPGLLLFLEAGGADISRGAGEFTCGYVCLCECLLACWNPPQPVGVKPQRVETEGVIHVGSVAGKA